MRNSILHQFSESKIIDAALAYIKDKLDWGEKPSEIIVDDSALFFEYEKSGENLARLAINEEGILIMYSKGKKKKYAWIEFERFDGLRNYIKIKASI